MFSFVCESELSSNVKDYIIKEILVRDACRFNRIWHSRLPIIDESNIIRNKYHVCYGAFNNGICVAIAIWSSPVARSIDQNTTLELRRLTISENAPKNMATYMIGKMIKSIKMRFPEIIKAISYQDTAVHTGTIYKAANWHIGSTVKFTPWDVSRKRSKSQAPSDKIRWEYDILS